MQTRFLSYTTIRKPLYHHGFTLIELLVVIGILVLLLSIFVPAVLKKRESARRIQCAANLNQIHNALAAYAKDNEYNFPRVIYDAEANLNGYIAFTGPDANDPFAMGGAVKPNDVTASLWLLVRSGLASPAIFICPSSNDSPDPMLNAAGKSVQPTQRGNFRKASYLSYSYSSPFSSAPGYRMNDTQPSDFAVLADKNPGKEGVDDNILGPPHDAPPLDHAKANSNNHKGAGQNVLYADGHVAFQRTAYCGVGKDNIYTALWPTPLEPGHSPPANGIGYFGSHIGPAWHADSYLVPTDDEGPR